MLRFRREVASAILPDVLMKGTSARLIQTALACPCVFIWALLYSCGVTDANDIAELPKDDPSDGSSIELVVEAGKFDADELLLPGRQEARVIIINNDAVTYYFEIPLLLGQKRIVPHSTKALDIPARALVLANPPLQEFEGHLLNAQLELIDTVEVMRRLER